jgi:hypothetical protein
MKYCVFNSIDLEILNYLLFLFAVEADDDEKLGRWNGRRTHDHTCTALDKSKQHK